MEESKLKEYVLEIFPLLKIVTRIQVLPKSQNKETIFLFTG